MGTHDKKPGAMRLDAGKLRYDLLSTPALEALVRVLTKGAEKYSDHAWRKGMAWSRVYASLQRHAQAYNRGEDRDPESGELHSAHIMANAMFLVEFQYTGAGQDDRHKLPQGIEDVVQALKTRTQGELERRQAVVASAQHALAQRRRPLLRNPPPPGTKGFRRLLNAQELLYVLIDGPTQTEAARKLQVSEPTVREAVRDLVRKGFNIRCERLPSSGNGLGKMKYTYLGEAPQEPRP